MNCCEPFMNYTIMHTTYDDLLEYYCRKNDVYCQKAKNCKELKELMKRSGGN